MRKMRKTLSLLLVLALVLGSFSMVFGAGVVDKGFDTLSDIADLKGHDHIQVCQALGIITGMPDGTYRPRELVNRAQFAAIITRALGIPESALAGYTTTSFLDTSGYGWAVPYLAYCQARGIMLGDGYGNAMPGRTINTNEAITMILRAIGYSDASEELIGKWPSNYVTLGQNKGIYDKLSQDIYMDRENAAIAIYNALLVQLVYTDLEGRTEHTTINDPGNNQSRIPATLLYPHLECLATTNTVLDDDYIGHALINVVDRIGEFGTAYTMAKTDILVAFKPNDDTFLLTGKLGDPGKFETNDGKVYSIATDAGRWMNNPTQVITGYTGAGAPIYGNYYYNRANVFMNASKAGITLATYTDMYKAIKQFSSAVNEDTPTPPAGDLGNKKTDGKEVTISVKLSGLTIRDVYALVGWKVTDAQVISAGELEAITEHQELLAGAFEPNDDGVIDTRQFSLVGASRLSDISEGDVVYVYAADRSGVADVIRKVAVGKETVEGALDKVNDNEFIIGGKAYKYASNYLVNAQQIPATDAESVRDSAGEDAIALLDAYGNGFDIDVNGGRTFGVIASTAALGVRGYEVRMTTQDDERGVYLLARASKFTWYQARPFLGSNTPNTKLTKRGATLDTDDKISTALWTDLIDPTKSFFFAPTNTLGGTDGTAATAKEAPFLYGYKLDKTGAISSLQDPISRNALTTQIRSASVLEDAGKSIPIDLNAVVFAVEHATTSSGEDIIKDIVAKDVSSLDILELRKARTAGTTVPIQYVLNRRGDKVGAILISADYTSGDANSVYGVVEDYHYISRSGKALSISALIDGKAETYETIDDTFTGALDIGLTSTPTAFKLTLDGAGKVKGVLAHVDLPASEGTYRNDAIVHAWGKTINGTSTDLASGQIRPGNDRMSYIVMNSGDLVPVERTASVYMARWNGKNYEYFVSRLSGITKDAQIYAYDTKGKDDYDRVATVVIWVDKEFVERVNP